ncbi:MAG: hypothetical protein R2932_24755 [Caldilineaceae bacterium]
MSRTTLLSEPSALHSLLAGSAELGPPVRRIAMLSVHTCPLALLGGKRQAA